MGNNSIWKYVAGALGALLVVAVGVGVYREKFALKCNGHRQLCDRKLNEVAIPMTHNAMSIADYDWFAPSHEHSVTNQLESGIRGLMLDTHYWDAAASISSYFPNASDEQLLKMGEVSDEIGLETREGTYVCHIICQLGYTSLSDTLGEIALFLDQNPNEVIVIIFEDKIEVTDTVEVFEESGLVNYAYEHSGGEWPTLRELISTNKRLVAMSESDFPPPYWYSHAWNYTEETPYSFEDKDNMGCEPNRGEKGSDFFLLNHWVENFVPKREDAVEVNQYEFLLERARRCAKERGFDIPNFVSVNFSEYGDVVGVTNTLNGLGN
ncbi:hypothetical protein ACFL2C_03310 [Patescibacteria group bacterium]